MFTQESETESIHGGSV